ncbi:MAG: transglycosylase SLT domain-containing protein [Caldilineaceae bacterium]|nr:transglycosylase SLT domain-containing protein [Caldilineaceae bacterium]
MPRRQQIEIISPHGQVRFYALDPSVGVVNIGQHPDNDIVLDGPDVRPFHGLVDYRRQPFQYAALGEEGGFGEERPFSQWERLQIGGHELVLVEGEQAGLAMNRPGQFSSLPNGQTPPDATPLPSESPMEAHWHARPGQTVRNNLTIQNSGDNPATFHISLTGVPLEWVWLSQEATTLPPGGQASVQLSVTPPLGPDTVPDIYPLTWQMTSPEYPDWVHREALYLKVDAAPAVQISRPEPTHTISPAFRRAGKAGITVANWGNVPAQVYLSGQERRGDCLVQIDPAPNAPGQEDGIEWERPEADGAIYPNNLLLQLPPGGIAHLRLTITPVFGRRFGMGSLHHRYTVSSQSVDGSFAPLSSSGTFESRPAIRMGFIFLLVLVLALGALYLWRDSFVSNITRARTRPLAAQVDSPAPRLAWMAPSADRVPVALLSTGGATHRPGDQTYTEMFQDVARLYGVDWRQLASQAYRESRLNPNAQGSAGEYGLMQILPSTWNEWAPLVKVDNPWDPYSNILVGAAYYSYIHSYFSDLGYSDPQWALAAYNWGPERTLGLLDRGSDWFSLPLTQRMYVADILIGVENAQALTDEAEVRYPQ